MRILAIAILCCSFAINVSYAQSYEDSPSNFNNSPVNFKNSPANFENSPVNFNNSPTNFDNSAANYNRQKAAYEYNSSLSRQTTLQKAGKANIYNNSMNRTRYVGKDGRMYDDNGNFLGYASPRPGRDLYRYDENGNPGAYQPEQYR